MRRPLFAAAVAMVAVAWIRLAAGDCDSSPPIPADMEKSEVYVTGQVCQKEDNVIWLKSVIINDSIYYDEKLICELTDDSPEPPLGCRVSVSGTFASISRATNPGEFDSAVYYRSLGAGGRLWETRVLAQGGRFWRLREALYRLRTHFKERLYRVFPQREATVMCALLLGEKGDTDKELKELYKRNGILHILSISSLHITILGMSLYKLLRKSGLPVPLCAGAGGMVLVLYGMMTGFSVSACRAIGMYLIRMFGMVCGRTYDMLTSLGILAAVMTTVNPYYLQNAGFLLSFSSVLGIGAVYPALVPEEYPAGQRYYGESSLLLLLRKLLQKLKYAVLASLAITLTTLPVQLWFYYEVPVWSVLLNLFVLPLMQPLLISGFFSLVPGLGFLKVADLAVLRWYEGVCLLFDKLPLGTWNPGRPEIWQIAVYYGMLAGVLALKRFKGDGRSGKAGRLGMDRKAGILQGCLLVLAVWILAVSPGAQNQVLFLDVGQGDCCLVRTENGTSYLFDCGSSSRSGVGQYVLLPALKYYGIHTLDGVFLSHPDTDHMNGILELLALAEDNRLTVEQLILPAIDEEVREEQFEELLEAAEALGGKQGGAAGDGVRVAWLAAGDSWDCGDVSFLCLNPAAGCDGAEKNAYSQCIYGDFGSFSLLLTGDTEGEGEKALLSELQGRGIDSVTLLKVAHHGSRNSTSSEILGQIRPRAAVISCGRSNRYGHPHGELLERLEEAGSHVLRTDQGGAVLVQMKGGQVTAGYYLP